MDSQFNIYTNQINVYEKQIENYEKLIVNCNQQIMGESDLDRITNLNAKIQNYFNLIEETETNKRIIQIQQSRNQLDSSSPESSSNNHQYNLINQQELKIDECLPYIDFTDALTTFETITSNFSNKRDVALFFMEKIKSNKGELFLKRMRHDLKENITKDCQVGYTSGGLESVKKGIATSFGIQFDIEKEKESIELVIEKIGKNLQNDSVVFLEINCEINYPEEIEDLILWFIDKFWAVLIEKITEISEGYEGVKIIAVITSTEIISNLKDSCLNSYWNNTNHNDNFERKKLVKIPLSNNWSQEEVTSWLMHHVSKELKRAQANKIVKCIYLEASQTFENDKNLPSALVSIIEKNLNILLEKHYRTNY